MKKLLILSALLISLPAHAFELFNLNVFDQLQGDWQPGFRERRLAAVADYVKRREPAIVIFQEAMGAGADSPDAAGISSLYPYRKYVHEMTGKDGASYGYWIGAQREPDQWIEDGFFFPGGVERKVQGALFRKAADGDCLGVLSLHLSYQTSEVRVKEARWVLDWLKQKEKLCSRWLVVGDFNADQETPEIKALVTGGLKPLYRELKPTVGAFNPIRRIYGDNIPSKTIDWAFGWNLEGEAEVVLDSPWRGEWVSDHAAVQINVGK